jgi:hypothetical protein
MRASDLVNDFPGTVRLQTVETDFRICYTAAQVQDWIDQFGNLEIVEVLERYGWFTASAPADRRAAWGKHVDADCARNGTI